MNRKWITPGRAVSTALALISLATIAIGTARAAPKYAEYETEVYDGVRATGIDYDPDTPPDENWERALAAPIDFAGRFVVVQKPTVKGCTTGDVIDVEMGLVYPLPFASCSWSEGYSRPFEYKKESSLIIVAGRVGDHGARGAHYFNFHRGSFTYLVSKLANGEETSIAELDDSAADLQPAAGPPLPSDIPADFDGELTKVLVLAVLRTDFPDASLDAFDADGAVAINKMAKVLRSTSVRQPFTANGVRYNLLYNWMADVFILLRYDGDKVGSIGIVSAPTVANRLYERPAGDNVFTTLLVDRPALFKAFSRDLPAFPQFERIFGAFLTDEIESLTVRDSLTSIQTLIKFGIQDACAKAVEQYVADNSLTFNGKTLPQGQRVYVSHGFPAAEGRAIAFADRASNQHVGFVMFGHDDTTTCTPKRVLTSGFSL